MGRGKPQHIDMGVDLIQEFMQFLVTTSKALVTRSDALVTTSFLLLCKTTFQTFKHSLNHQKIRDEV